MLRWPARSAAVDSRSRSWSATAQLAERGMMPSRCPAQGWIVASGHLPARRSFCGRGLPACEEGVLGESGVAVAEVDEPSVVCPCRVR